MGLDSVELLVRTEDTFGIVIKDSDAEKVSTVSDLVNTVLMYLKSRPKLICKSQHVFYRLRKSLTYRDSKAICLNDPLSKYLKDKSEYKNLEELSDLKFPNLTLPNHLNWTMILSTIAIIIMLCSYMFDSFVFFIMGTLLFFGWIKLYEFVVYKYSTVLPKVTMREFIESITHLNYKEIHPEFHSNLEVKVLVKRLISDSMGIDIHKIHGSSTLSRDLGID